MNFRFKRLFCFQTYKVAPEPRKWLKRAEKWQIRQIWEYIITYIRVHTYIALAAISNPVIIFCIIRLYILIIRLFAPIIRFYTNIRRLENICRITRFWAKNRLIKTISVNKG